LCVDVVGTEGLKELVPLLSDSEPLVQREAVQGLIMNGSAEASAILVRAMTTATGRAKQTLRNEAIANKDERAAPLYCYVLKHVKPSALPKLYSAAIEVL